MRVEGGGRERRQSGGGGGVREGHGEAGVREAFWAWGGGGLEGDEREGRDSSKGRGDAGRREKKPS